MSAAVCCIKGCDEPHYALSCCNRHYTRMRNGWPLVSDPAPRRNWKSFEVGECRFFENRKVGQQARTRGAEHGYRFKILTVPAGVRVTRVE